MAIDVSGIEAEDLDLGSLERAAACILDEIDRGDAELSISIVDDPTMQMLNRGFRERDRPTDVLAFSQLEGEALVSGSVESLGDVVISLDTARRQANRGGWTVTEELNRLLVHAVLHLLGYDHEAGAQEKEKMAVEERRLARVLEAAGMSCAREDA